MLAGLWLILNTKVQTGRTLRPSIDVSWLIWKGMNDLFKVLGDFSYWAKDENRSLVERWDSGRWTVRKPLATEKLNPQNSPNIPIDVGLYKSHVLLWLPHLQLEFTPTLAEMRPTEFVLPDQSTLWNDSENRRETWHHSKRIQTHRWRHSNI